jgi:hypothetical protein
MSVEIYKWLHLVGLGLVSFGFGALFLKPEDPSKRKIVSIVHGIGLFLVLLGGFAMAAHLKISTLEPWVLFKIVVWLGLGGFLAISKRKPEIATPIQVGLIVLATVAAYLGIFHNQIFS